MAWGDKGGWQSGDGGGPWSKGPRKPGGTPPSGSGGGGAGGKGKGPGGGDFDEFFRRGQDRFRNVVQGGGDGKLIALTLAMLLLLWFASGIYKVEADEQGVVLRFGAFHELTPPGLRYHLPYPIETVYTPSVTTINKVEIGSRSGTSGPTRASTEAMQRESLMLTSDLNIVDINFEVQWKINSARPQDFLFNVRDSAETVRPVAESAMREVVGQMALDRVLTEGQTEIASRTQEIMQQILDSYQAGVEVVSVNLSKPDVPAAVIDAFQDVKKAEQDRETTVANAEGYRNDILPKAQGEAVKIEQEAEAYKKTVVARAEGDAARFLSVYNEYKLAKDVTRKRIYLETMEEILRGMPKLVMDQDKSNVLPYLPLNQLQPAAGKGAKP